MLLTLWLRDLNCVRNQDKQYQDFTRTSTVAEPIGSGHLAPLGHIDGGLGEDEGRVSQGSYLIKGNGMLAHKET